jgi:predicted alpha/beta superfamily hydrolase
MKTDFYASATRPGKAAPFCKSGRASIMLRAVLFGSALLASACSSLEKAPPHSGSTQSATPLLPNVKIEDVHSRRGEVFRIFIAWPEGKAPANGWPVTYVLDGNDNFLLATEIQRRQQRWLRASGVAPGIIIGIGYPDKTRRAFDYTPAGSTLPPEKDRDAALYPELGASGGADFFLDFIAQELQPHLEKSWPINAAEKSLFGHSYGGLLVLHAFFTRPEAFQRYVASSPSLWWHDGFIRRAENSFYTQHNKTKAHLLISAGEYEQAPSADEIARSTRDELEKILALRRTRRMVDNSRELAARLQTAGLNVSYRYFPGEGHGSIVPAALSAALPELFPKQDRAYRN